MEKEKTRRDRIIVILTIIFSVNFILYGHYLMHYRLQDDTWETYERATVTQVMKDGKYKTSSDDQMLYFKAKIKSGRYKGQTVLMSQAADNLIKGNKMVSVKTGDHIMALKSSNSNNGITVKWQYSGPNRIMWLLVMLGIFLALILLIGRKKGFATIITLVLTVMVICMVYIPSILAGFNIYISTMVVSIFIILSSLIILNGVNKKTLCAIVGNLGGTISAAVLALFFNDLLNVTGIVNEESVQISLLKQGINVDLKGLVWASVVIGSLGAVMDVAMSLASSMQELSNEMKEKNYSRICQSGLNIGRDAIGTMANTLILAYVGGAFSLMILMFAYHNDVIYLLNLETITVEVSKALIGNIGLLLAVPLTVAFSGWIFTRESGHNNSDDENANDGDVEYVDAGEATGYYDENGQFVYYDGYVDENGNFIYYKDDNV